MICAIFIICRLLSVTFVMYFKARNKDLYYYYFIIIIIIIIIIQDALNPIVKMQFYFCHSVVG